MASDFLSGLVQGLAGAQQRSSERFLNEEVKKAQIKAFKHDLEQKEKTAQALAKVQEFFKPQPTIERTTFGEGGPEVAPPQKRELTDLLADPEMTMNLLQSGKAKDIMSIQQFQSQQGQQEFIKNLITGDQGQPGQPGQPGGLEFSGLKVGPKGEFMPDFARPKFKTEVPSGDGMTMIGLDEFGREMYRRPMGPGEKKPPQQTPGERAVDTKFADELVTFEAAGGFADVEKQLSQLREASSALEEETGLTGPVVGAIPEAILKRTNPQAIAVRDAVLESVQRNLRLVLGAQFTEREGEMLLARSYDRALPQAENKKRVDRLIKQIESAAEAKRKAIEYFQENKTLSGFKGKTKWKVEEFIPPEPENKPSLKGLGKRNKVVDFNDLP